MKRRKFLRGAAAGVLGGATTVLAACTQQQAGRQNTAGESKDQNAQAPAQGSAQPAVEWRCGTSWVISLDTIYGGAETIAARVAAMTNGKFKIIPFPGGELFPPLEVLQNVQQGTIECGHTASYYYVGLNSALGFATSVPFGLTAQQQNAWLYYGDGLTMMRKVFADFNTINFPAGNTGAQMGGWFRKEIQTLNDIKGLKMRIPGLGGKVMERLGVLPQTLPSSDIYQALQTGAIDATEWVGPYDDQKLGFHEVAAFYYTPGWWEPGPTLDLQVNIDAYNTLPKEYQEILATAAYYANIDMLSKYDALNRIALESLLANGVQLRVYSDEILQAAQKAAFELFDESAHANPSFKAIYEPWKTFRAASHTWNQTNELPFSTFVAKHST